MKPFLAACGQHEVCTFRKQAAGCGFSDSGGRACDNH
jgi:hypothetical protein